MRDCLLLVDRVDIEQSDEDARGVAFNHKRNEHGNSKPAKCWVREKKPVHDMPVQAMDMRLPAAFVARYQPTTPTEHLTML